MKRAPTISEQEALQVARLWDSAARRVERGRAGENATWTTESHGRRAILRLTSEQHRTRDQIEAELDFVEYLAAGGLSVACPLSSTNRERVVELPKVAPGAGRSWGVMFERLEGRHYEYDSPDIDRPLFRLWGETMGRLHDLSSRFEPEGQRRRPDWCDDPVAGCITSGVPAGEELLAVRDELIDWLSGIRPEPDQYGMVHGDFERTNFLLRDGVIGLFDFDDSCCHWFIWDVACALWVFRNAAPAERSRFLGWFLEGYSSIREPDVEQLAFFTEFVRLRSVAVLLHRLRNREFPHSESDRQWEDQTRSWLRSSWSW